MSWLQRVRRTSRPEMFPFEPEVTKDAAVDISCLNEIINRR